MRIGINLPRLEGLLLPVRSVASKNQSQFGALHQLATLKRGTLEDHVSVFSGRFALQLYSGNEVQQDLQPPAPAQHALIGKIRKQLDVIRSAVSDNLRESPSNRDGVKNQAAVDDAIVEIARLTDTRVSLGGTQNARVGQFNPRQIADVDVLAFDVNSPVELTGEVLRTARAAELRIRGLGVS